MRAFKKGQMERETQMYINTHIYRESRKMAWMNLFACKQWKRRHSEQTGGHGKGRRGWDELGEQS